MTNSETSLDFPFFSAFFVCFADVVHFKCRVLLVMLMNLTILMYVYNTVHIVRDA